MFAFSSLWNNSFPLPVGTLQSLQVSELNKTLETFSSFICSLSDSLQVVAILHTRYGLDGNVSI